MAQVERSTSSQGTAYLTNVLSVLQFKGKTGGSLNNFLNGEFSLVGFEADDIKEENIKTKIIFDVYIPDDFKIKEAKITLSHFPLKLYNMLNQHVGWGHSRALKIYQAFGLKNIYREYVANSQFSDIETESYTEIAGVFGDAGYTPSIPTNSNYILESFISGDLKFELKAGLNRFKIQSSETPPTYTEGQDEVNLLNLASKSGMVSATLTVIGY